MTHRRIDGRPQQFIRARIFATAGGRGGGNTGARTPVDDGTTPPGGGGETPGITLIDTFSGGGDAGSATTFDTVAPLLGGDILLTAYAWEYGTPGSISCSPNVSTFTFPSLGAVACACTLFKIPYESTGITSFTITVGGGACSYYGWILRGAATAFSTPEIVAAYDDSLISYTGAALPNPDPCDNELSSTVWDASADVVAPASGSFMIYGASARAGVCTGDTPGIVLTGSASQTKAGTVGTSAYDFGTIGDGFSSSASLTADVDAAEHGVSVGAFVYAIAPRQ